MGGFITASARLARQNIRPLLLPTPTNPNPSPLKPVYDILGTVTSVMILNYTAAPFIILSASDSIRTWKVLGWYGHVIVMGSLLFFYFGGTRYFRGLQKAKGILPPSKGKPGATNGVSTPLAEKNFVLPPSVDKIVPPQ